MTHTSNLPAPIPGHSSGSSADWLRSPAYLCSVVLALTFATYAETLSFGFVFDDWGQIVDNPAIHSWAFVPSYFTKQVWAGFFPEDPGNYYRPLFLLWLRVNDALWGLHPWGWHLTALVAHLAATLLVYFLALRVLRDPLYSAIVSLLFGLHPVHIEGVAWISGVTEPLLAVLLISSFLCYLKEREGPAKAAVWKALSMAFYILAVLEKETALVFPAIIFSYEWVSSARQKVESPGRGVSTAGLLRRVRLGCWSAMPYLLPVPFYLWARVHALKGFSHALTPLPFSAVVYTWPSLLWFWVKHLVWPTGLSTLYDLHSVTLPNAQNFTLPSIGVVVLALGLCWGATRVFEIAFACIWLVWPLIPILDIRVFPRNDFAHDRYLYLPSIGLAIAAVVALRCLRLGSARLGGVPAGQILATLLVAALMVFGTVLQSAYFKNDLVFYLHNFQSAPNNEIAKVNAANALGQAGQYEIAFSLYRQVLERNPGSWYANYNMGYTYYRLGKLQEAETYLERAIVSNPNKPDEHFYLGLTLLKMSHTDEAVPSLRRAIEIRPRGFGYHFALGLALKLQGNLQGALEEFKAEISIRPEYAPARQQIAEIQETLNSQRPR